MDTYLDYFRNKSLAESRLVSTSEFQTSAAQIRFKSQNYLVKKQIFETFHFLIGHLILHQPEDPIRYLYQLLDDCILFRLGLKQPRLFWMKKQLNSIFRNISVRNSGFVSIDSYKFSMKMFNIHSYNPCPVECTPGYVNWQTFCSEIMNSMEYELARITEKPTCC
ncbi:uncharacterized protein LOC143260282 [Megalopta genalis]|uniref:uncharacterized protein LOC143260282 n=1 Tax=Megalopta genalis TaxID=115081 RepID=UPI003FCF11DD